MKLIYPAIFTPYFDEGGYDVTFPDLPNCTAFGDSLEEAIENAADQASRCILTLMENGEDVPPASDHSEIEIDDPDDFLNYTVAGIADTGKPEADCAANDRELQTALIDIRRQNTNPVFPAVPDILRDFF